MSTETIDSDYYGDDRKVDLDKYREATSFVFSELGDPTFENFIGHKVRIAKTDLRGISSIHGWPITEFISDNELQKIQRISICRIVNITHDYVQLNALETGITFKWPFFLISTFPRLADVNYKQVYNLIGDFQEFDPIKLVACNFQGSTLGWSNEWSEHMTREFNQSTLAPDQKIITNYKGMRVFEHLPYQYPWFSFTKL